MEFKSTAIYPNRLEDKELLESKIPLQEEGNDMQEFFLPDQSRFAVGYTRVVYGDHGPYVEFDKKHIVCNLRSKFGNTVDYDSLPGEDFQYYYFWLHPVGFSNVKVYLQIKTVANLPNAPKRQDGKKSNFNRKEGYADYKRGFFYVDPYELRIKNGSH